MKSYKGWTPEQRILNLKLYKVAIELGIISKPTKCRRCGQTKGILQCHCEDYGYSLEMLPKLISKEIEMTDEIREKLSEVLEDLCWTCHMAHHSFAKFPEQVKKYWIAVSNGYVAPAVYSHDYSKLIKILNEL